jgi:hypothetical protein
MFRFAVGVVVGVLMALAMRRLLAVPAPPLSAIATVPQTHTLAVEAPIALALTPIRVKPWARIKASVMRFAKVFVFVLLGLVAASLTTPEGLSALLEPQALIVLVVASTVGALLKAAQWSDVGITDAVPSVTMQFSPPKAVSPPLSEGLAQ